MEHDPFMQPLEDEFMQPEPETAVPEPEQPPAEKPAPEIPMPTVFERDYQRMMALPPISKQEAESCRHSHEKRWYRRLIEINILMIVTVVLMVFGNLDSYREKISEFRTHLTAEIMESLHSKEESGSEADAEETADAGEQDDTDSETDEDTDKKDDTEEYMTEFIEDIPIELRILVYGIVTLIFGYLGLYMALASVKASAVKITQKNFPEIYQLIFSYAQRLGMKKVPDAYIVQQGGVLNAFSSFIPHRQFIVINTEIFEVAYREHQDLNALSFIIAHELSHIYYGHATLHYNLPIWFSMNAPLFGQIASRTREYSCDRLAQRLTNYDGLDAMLILMVDRHLYTLIDKQDYVDQTINERGFFLWLLNLISTHPIMPKRIRALVRWSGSGELY